MAGQASQWLFRTSLFVAALAFHNCAWRYISALGREGVLPAALGRTGANSIPKAASLTQSLTGLAVITVYAVGGWPSMTNLFFWLGTTGGFGILILLAATSVAVIVFFARDPRGEHLWSRLAAPALAAILLTGIVVLAVALDRHHPAGIPHQHLAILAVDPDQQERGIATRLLDVWHATLEEYGTPAYLEASSPRRRDLYLAHGYTLGPDAPYHLPDGGPPMWPMWRQPGVRPGRNDAR